MTPLIFSSCCATHAVSRRRESHGIMIGEKSSVGAGTDGSVAVCVMLVPWLVLLVWPSSPSFGEASNAESYYFRSESGVWCHCGRENAKAPT